MMNCLYLAGPSTSGIFFIRSPQPIVAPPGDRVSFEWYQHSHAHNPRIQIHFSSYYYSETNVPPERVVWLHNRVEVSGTNLSTSSPRKKGKRNVLDDTAASFRLYTFYFNYFMLHMHHSFFLSLFIVHS